jgi:hypothetical protein
MHHQVLTAIVPQSVSAFSASIEASPSLRGGQDEEVERPPRVIPGKKSTAYRFTKALAHFALKWVKASIPGHLLIRIALY